VPFPIETEASLLAICEAAPFMGHRTQAARLLGTDKLLQGLVTSESDPALAWSRLSRYSMVREDSDGDPLPLIPLPAEPLKEAISAGIGGAGPETAHHFLVYRRLSYPGFGPAPMAEHVDAATVQIDAESLIADVVERDWAGFTTLRDAYAAQIGGA
jgi:hypothetical protein